MDLVVGDFWFANAIANTLSLNDSTLLGSAQAQSGRFSWIRLSLSDREQLTRAARSAERFVVVYPETWSWLLEPRVHRMASVVVVLRPGQELPERDLPEGLSVVYVSGVFGPNHPLAQSWARGPCVYPVLGKAPLVPQALAARAIAEALRRPGVRWTLGNPEPQRFVEIVREMADGPLIPAPRPVAGWVERADAASVRDLREGHTTWETPGWSVTPSFEPEDFAAADGPVPLAK